VGASIFALCLVDRLVSVALGAPIEKRGESAAATE